MKERLRGRYRCEGGGKDLTVATSEVMVGRKKEGKSFRFSSRRDVLCFDVRSPTGPHLSSMASRSHGNCFQSAYESILLLFS